MKYESIYKVGNKVLVRSVTYHYVGEICYLDERELQLKDASWIAESGPWTKALTEGKLADVEAYPDPVSIERDKIVDGTIWRHKLTR